jgi:hypothetical protein
MRRGTLLVICLAIPLAACGRGTTPDPEDPDAQASDPDADVRPDSAVQDFSEVYAHSGTQLYRIDTQDLEVLPVGAFGSALGTASMTDIAVDKDGRMIGVSLSRIFSIEPGTGVATELAMFEEGGGFTSLSFVPVDPTNPDSAERLVAADDQGAVFEVTYDLQAQTAAATQIGSYGMTDSDELIRSSGDIVSVRGVGTLATVTIGLPLEADDYLAWIDTTTWQATPIGTASTGYDKIFGLGYWGGTIFGFVDNSPGAQTGSLVTIDINTGVATPAVNSAFRWYGAGVTTKAPIVD